jgi:hypothetical protein
MRNFDRALMDIATIRSQLAAGTQFQGFGPEVMAVSGLCAAGLAFAQSLWPALLAQSHEQLLWGWVILALLLSALIMVEARARARRHHAGLANQMVQNALEQFLPSVFAGAALFAIFLLYSPDELWLLPGLWQMLVSLGLFAALKLLPRSVALAAGWYLLSAVGILIMASQTRTLDPWMMGAPFVVGQSLLAAILHLAQKEEDK